MQREKSLINNGYKKAIVTFEITAEIFYKIQKHRKELCNKLKKQIKNLNKDNTNVIRINKIIEDDYFLEY